MRSTTFFKLYKICILLHRCNLKIFAKNRFEKSAIFVKFQQKLANFAKFANFCHVSAAVDAVLPDSLGFLAVPRRATSAQLS